MSDTAAPVPARRALTVLAVLCFTCALVGFTPITVARAAASDTEPAIEVSWDGETFAQTTTATFFDPRLSVPGDHDARTLYIRHTGPSAATMVAEISGVRLHAPDAPDVHHQPGHAAPDDSGDYRGAGPQGDFYDELLISWGAGEASMSELARQVVTPVLRVRMAPYDVVPLRIESSYPVAATSGNMANVERRLAQFDVVLRVSGDTPQQLPQTGGMEAGLLVGLASFGSIAVVAGAMAIGRVWRRGSGSRAPVAPELNR